MHPNACSIAAPVQVDTFTIFLATAMVETLDTVTLDKELVNKRCNATPYQVGQQLKLHALDIHFHDHKVLRLYVGR